MPKFNAKVLFEVFCAVCGEDLRRFATGEDAKNPYDTPAVRVAPCPTCLERARDEGRAAGLAEAQEE